MKKMIGFLYVILSFLGLAGCKTAEVVYYDHEPSEKFYESFDYEQGSIIDFKKNGILFVVDVNQIDQSSYIVWLGLYSQISGKNIDIARAELTGNGWKETVLLGNNFKLDLVVPGEELFKNSVMLFKVEGLLFNKIIKYGGDISLTVTYFQDGISKNLVFNIERRVEKHTVFST